MKPRVTLRQALDDPELLGSALAGPTWHPWRVILLAAMGEPLTKDELTTFTKFTGRTKALVPVHFAGRPCDMNSLCGLAERHGMKMIEDCDHAIETVYHGRKAGTFGDFGCFSFYVTKNVVTGEGGMVLTRREEDLARI